MNDSPILKLREFFSHKSKPVTLPEFTEFWKSCSDDEKRDLKEAIAKWDGASEHIAS